MRHVRFTPVEWQVAGALATGENLEPHISMRVAVLASHHTSEDDADAAPPVDSGDGPPRASDQASASPLVERRRTLLRRGEPSLSPLFNLKHGVALVGMMSAGDLAAAPSPPVDPRPLSLHRTLEGELEIVAADGSAAPAGWLLPACKRGDVVEVDADEGMSGATSAASASSAAAGVTQAVVTEADEVTGFCAVLLAVLAPTGDGPPQKRKLRPRAIVGRFDAATRTFVMNGGRLSPPEWIRRALDEPLDSLETDIERSPSALGTAASICNRLQLVDSWWDAERWLDETGSALRHPDVCALRLATQPSAPALLVRPDGLAYECGRGTRVGLASALRSHEAVGTVVAMEPGGDLIVSVDNTASTRAFLRWSLLCRGRRSKGAANVPHAVTVRATPAELVQAAALCYVPGTRLMLLSEGAYVDATVVAGPSAGQGNRHLLRFEGRDRDRHVDLNELNHAQQRFESVGALVEARRRYLARLTSSAGRQVEDAITGRTLLIDKQLLHISMATGDDAVSQPVAWPRALAVLGPFGTGFGPSWRRLVAAVRPVLPCCASRDHTAWPSRVNERPRRSQVKLSGEAIGRLPSDDVVWTLGATTLRPGDRVRHVHSRRLGYVGFKNGDGATVRLAAELRHVRFVCGRVVAGAVCGGADGKGSSCRACRRFLAENRQLADGARTALSVHVEYDDEPSGGGGPAAPPRRELLLAHEVERASALCGVHIEEWNGCAFQSGDVVAISDGVVTHRRSGKTAPLSFGYKPLLLSTLPNAKSSTVELVRGNGVKRVRGSGGVAFSASPIKPINGEVSFEVEVRFDCQM